VCVCVVCVCVCVCVWCVCVCARARTFVDVRVRVSASACVRAHEPAIARSPPYHKISTVPPRSRYVVRIEVVADPSASVRFFLSASPVDST
jgi:hypothetical protein